MGLSLLLVLRFDLNPVRAGLVDDPKDYRFCGYAGAVAHAIGTGQAARKGLLRVWADDAGRGGVEAALRAHRALIFGKGGDPREVKGRVMDRRQVAEVLEVQDAVLPKAAVLRCRVRYFTEGFILGSSDYVSGFVEAVRMDRKRKHPPKVNPIRGADWGDLAVIHEAFDLASARSLQVYLSFMKPCDASEEKTLLDWAVRLCPDSPRKRVKDWIASGRFCLDGRVVTKAGLRLPDPGGALTLGAPNESAPAWGHRKRIHPKLVLVYLDADLAIVDKEAGLLSVPTENQAKISAIEVLANYLNDPKGEATRRSFFGSADPVKPLPVHRLDQFTSGLLCIALNDDARRHLIRQLRTHDFLREYIAYADGDASQPSGTWRNYLQLDEKGYDQKLLPEPEEGATEAVTHYRVEEVFPRHHVAKLRIRLETGLKHQIRIQAAAHGMPLVGDRMYHEGTRKAVAKKGAKLPYGFKRQALHAATIGIRHPRDGRKLKFDSKIPGDMQLLEERLRSSA